MDKSQIITHIILCVMQINTCTNHHKSDHKSMNAQIITHIIRKCTNHHTHNTGIALQHDEGGELAVEGPVPKEEASR